MKDNFQWTPELLAEFFNSYPVSEPMLQMKMDKFKSSKAPKKEWEVVDLKNEYGHIENYHHFNEGVVEDKITKGKLTIHSVRRLSDGEIFSVGDRILFDENRKRTITSFSFIDGELGIYYEGGAFNSKVYTDLRKLPAPVLTTEDGVEIYSWDNFKPTIVFGDSSLRADAYEDYWLSAKASYPDAKLFSTREAAETYILNNVRLLSLNDVKEAAKNENWHTALIERLTALVKQKLNP